MISGYKSILTVVVQSKTQWLYVWQTRIKLLERIHLLVTNSRRDFGVGWKVMENGFLMIKADRLYSHSQAMISSFLKTQLKPFLGTKIIGDWILGLMNLLFATDQIRLKTVGWMWTLRMRIEITSGHMQKSTENRTVWDWMVTKRRVLQQNNGKYGKSDSLNELMFVWIILLVWFILLRIDLVQK